MSALLKQLHAMSINKVQPPDELLALYNWIEENGFIEEYNDGFLYGRISHDWNIRQILPLLHPIKRVFIIGLICQQSQRKSHPDS
jgi:hypothetical protein